MSVQAYCVPDQTERRKKAFLEWTSTDLYPKLSLSFGIKFNYYTSVHHPVRTLGTGNNLAIFKTNH